MKKNIVNTLLLVALSSIVAFFSISYIFIPAQSFSENENRVLQTNPRFTFEKLLDGTYTRQLHDYFSDQINLRNSIIELKSLVELAMGKNENNGVILGKDGYLIEVPSYTDDNYRYLQNNLRKIEKLMDSLKESGVKVSSALIPQKIDVLTDKLPPYYSTERDKEIWQLVSENHINLTIPLSNNNGVFYRTDHHWTAEGAYLAYSSLADTLGYTPLPFDRFNIQVLSNEFQGTTYSTSGFFFTSAEPIKAPSIENGRYKMTIVDISAEFDTLYDTSYLNKKDKYSTFLSGNNAHVKIYDTKDNEKETLLIIKDSFSHSLAPYLCEHYNLELIDPRYFSGSIEDYIKENNIKNVLFIFGIDTLASANIVIR